jgi:hypothetical protein
MRLRSPIAASLSAGILLLAGCASAPQTREYVDNDTAATISVSNDSWIFARERPDLAVHAQDYITMTPVQVNRAGRRVVYLYCQLWSTIDRRRDTSIVPPKSELAIVADDRRIVLPQSGTDVRSLGMGHIPVPPPNSAAEIRVVAIDLDLLRSIATADQVRVALNMEHVTDYFLTWRNGQAAVLDFLRHIETGP